jgi:hypothetical protein
VKDVTVPKRGSEPPKQAGSLAKLGIAVAGPVELLRRYDRCIRAILGGDQFLDFDVACFALGCDVRSDLASALGPLRKKLGA